MPALGSVAREIGLRRVLYVVDSLEGGGAERHVVDLATALHRRGYEVAVACSISGVLAPALEAEGIAIHSLLGRLVKRRLSLSYAKSIRRVLDDWRPDVVHAHLYASSVATAMATVGMGVPVVLTEHTEAPWRSRGAACLSWFAYQRAVHIVAVSSAIQRLLVTRYRVPADRVSFVLPAIPEVVVANGSRTASDSQLRVGHVGRLQPEKGVDVFLRAVAAVRSSFPSARFLVVGEGPLRPGLTALADELRISDCVEFLGFRPDARRLIGELDLLAVASRSDGSPLVVLEAMTAGVPVVATTVGGMPDQIAHGLQGTLVPAEDHVALADAIRDLLEHPNRRTAMGAAGRRRAAELTHHSMVERMLDLYAMARTQQGDAHGKRPQMSSS